MTDSGLEAPEARQLDFWLGEWDVSWGDDQHGTNRVVSILDGRVIQENFDGGASMPFRGISVSVYNQKLHVWQQTWVDTAGNYWNFEGEFKEGCMIFATDDLVDGKPVKLRMVFDNIEHDTLDWNWEQSDDGGDTWQLKWKIYYRRKN